MVTATDLEFGLKSINLKAPALWGCSAIAPRIGSRAGYDIPPDRKSFVGDAVTCEVLRQALNAGALAQLLTALASRPPRDDRIRYEAHGGVNFWFRARGGYLYVTAAIGG